MVMSVVTARRWSKTSSTTRFTLCIVTVLPFTFPSRETTTTTTKKSLLDRAAKNLINSRRIENKKYHGRSKTKKNQFFLRCLIGFSLYIYNCYELKRTARASQLKKKRTTKKNSEEKTKFLLLRLWWFQNSQTRRKAITPTFALCTGLFQLYTHNHTPYSNTCTKKLQKQK